MQAILIPVGPEVYALPSRRVREVVPEPRITPVPTAPPTVLGLFNVRGEIIFLFDTAALLGLGRVGKVTHAVVVETGLGDGALAVSGAPRVAELKDPVGACDKPWGVGIYTVGDQLAVLLDPEILLAPAPVAT